MGTKLDQPLRVLVYASRDFNDPTRMTAILDALDRKYGVGAIIQGGERAADRFAVTWARAHRKEINSYPALWRRMNLPLFLRDVELFKQAQPDAVLAFVEGENFKRVLKVAESMGVIVWA